MTPTRSYLIAAGIAAAALFALRPVPTEHPPRTAATGMTVAPDAQASRNALSAPEKTAGESAPIVARPASNVLPGSLVTIFARSAAGEPVRIEQIPSGRLRRQLEQLTPASRDAALAKLSDLRIPVADVGSLQVDNTGQLFYTCEPPPAIDPMIFAALAATEPTGQAPVPVSTPPARSSRPGASKVIYLDFNGHTVTGTAWNDAAESRPAVATYVAVPYDTDGNATTFGDDEQARIIETWARVAEDFAPFDVDVTTVAPSVFTATTIRVVITRSTDANGVDLPSPDAGGVAYIGVFGQDQFATRFSPAFVYFDNVSGGIVAGNLAEVISHEAGHNLSLSHDGTTLGDTYYSGHGSGETSWAPLMGSSYWKDITQWSKGDYANANNTQDDLAILAGHLGYQPDDHSDSQTSPTALQALGPTSFREEGFIGSETESDWFAVTVSAPGVLTLTATPFRAATGTDGGNLDAALQLADSSGTLETANDPSKTGASIARFVNAGTYRLRVNGAAGASWPNNAPFGYPAYASLGHYVVTAEIAPSIPPVFTSHPVARSSEAGSLTAVVFSAIATGNPTPTLQWQRLAAGAIEWTNLTNGGGFSGVTSTDLILTSVTLAMNGDTFRCVATNSGGTTSSFPAQLTVTAPVAPGIYSLPAHVARGYGDTLELIPTITGSNPISYQWYRNALAIAGATGASYHKPSVTDADAGTYTLVATNSAGSTTSSGVIVTVAPAIAPVFHGYPTSIEIATGEQLSISPSVVGTEPMTFQWEKDGSSLAGQTSRNFFKSAVTAEDGGSYILIATNAAGSSATAAITVSILAPQAPMILDVPPIVAIPAGESWSVGPVVTGSSPISYQWQKDGVDVPGANDRYLNIANASAAHEGVYRLLATNVVGTTTSSDVVVVVGTAVAPVIYNLPAVQAVALGQTLSLSPSIAGSHSFSCQWYKDGVAVVGATSSNFFRSSVTAADAGSYVLVATNVAGSTSSIPVVVTIGAPVAPAIFTHRYFAAPVGAFLSLTPHVAGSTPMTFQWRKNGVPIPGAISGSLHLSSVSPSDSGTYSLTAANSAGSITSSPMEVIVREAPPLAPIIHSVTPVVSIVPGGAFGISASVVGSQPITLQWHKDGQPIPGATQSSFFKSNATAADAGTYTLVATNGVATAVSTPVVATLQPLSPPVIVHFPVAVSLAARQSLNISASVGGTSPVFVQWHKDGVAIPGATSTTLFRSYTGVDLAGEYTLTATNSAGSVTSPPVLVTNESTVPPVIFDLPAGVSVTAGGTLSLSPSVVGSSPMSFQWLRDGVVLPGRINSNLHIPNVGPGDAGSYELIAINAGGTTTSTAVVVQIDPPIAPLILGLPSLLSVPAGQNLNLSPSIHGTFPMSFQWLRNGAPIPTANSSNYFKSSVSSADNGSYSLVATNMAGQTTSSAVTVTIAAPFAPVIYNLPAVFGVSAGNSFLLQPSIAGTSPMTFQWYRDGTAIPGATSSSYSRNPAQLGDAGLYTLMATNSAGTTTSLPVLVTVRSAQAPVIYNVPPAVGAHAGQSLQVSVSVAGGSPMTFQWYKDDIPIPGANGGTFFKYPATAADSGLYTLVVTNPAGTATSPPIAVTVVPAESSPPVFVGITPILSVQPGQSMSLSTGSVLGAQPITYQWRKDGVPIPGATGSSYFKSDIKADDAGLYTVAATNPFGAAVSAPIEVIVQPPLEPFISGMPVQLAIVSGASIFLSPSVSGTEPMVYQWRRNNVDIPGATSRSYSKSPATGADAGLYSLIATNVAGSRTSEPVEVIVSNPEPPQVIHRSDQVTVTAGGSLSLNPTVIGTQPMTCVWRKDGQVLANQTSASLFRSMMMPTDGGAYTLTASNEWGTMTSSPVQVTVLPPVAPSIWNLPTAVTIPESGTLTLSASVTGSMPMTMQWYKDDALIPGATSSQLHRASVTSADQGSYTLKATNLVGETTSAPVEVSVITASAPNIVNMPPDVVVVAGQSFFLNPTITGTQPIYLQWYKDGDIVHGATGQGFGRSSVTAADAGVYTLRATNIMGSVTSAPTQVTVEPPPPPVIVTQPLSQSVVPGQNFRLSVSASGSGSLSYQWRKGGVPFVSSGRITGATTNILDIGDVRLSDYGNYDVVVTNLGGSTTSAAALVTGINAPTAALALSSHRSPGDTIIIQLTLDDADGNLAYANLWVNIPDLGWHAIRADNSLAESSVLDSANQVANTAGVHQRQFTFPYAGNYEFRLQAVDTSGRLSPVASRVVSVGATAVPGDFDADGLGDLAWHNTQTGSAYMWFMEVDHYRAFDGVATLSAEWRLAGSGDFDGDGISDLVWYNTETGDTYMWFMNGSSYTSYAHVTTMGPGWLLTGTGDFNGDGRHDIVWRNLANGSTYIWFMDGPNYIAFGAVATLGLEWIVAGTGDFNADGKSDLIWRNTQTGDCYVWYMDGLTYTGYSFLTTMSAEWRLYGGVDFDGDGNGDLVWHNSTSGAVYVWLMDGTNYRTFFQLTTLGSEWRIGN